MPRKLYILGSILILLLVAALVVVRKSKPRTANANPLEESDQLKISKIVLEKSTEKIVLENGENGWMILSPEKDLVDDTSLVPLTTVLASARIGSVISEKKDSFSNYGLLPHQALHVQVFLSSQTTPSLDGYVGKAGASPNDSFFRFEGTDVVRMANDMPGYILRQESRSFRLQRFFKDDITAAVGFTVRAGKINYRLEKSSNTWTEINSGKVAVPNWVEELKVRIMGAELIIPDRSPTAELVSFAFVKPELTLTVVWPMQERTVVIGAHSRFPPAGHHVRIEGRDPIFLVSPEYLKLILEAIKKPIS